MRAKAAVCAIALLAIATNANAEGMTAGQLTTACLTDSSESQALCIGYFRGFFEGLQTARLLGSLRLAQTGLNVDVPKEFCPADDATADEMMNVAVAYILNKPEMFGDQPHAIIIAAWKNAFPC